MYKEHITGFVDFIGDKKAPARQFLHNIKHYGHLLDDNAENVINKKDIILRKLFIHGIVRLIGQNSLKNKQVFENRNYLKSNSIEDAEVIKKDSKIVLPKEPVIWASNHHFKDDVLSTYLATQRSAYILFGSLPQFYNTFDGILSNLVGSLMTNRKVKSSKHSSIQKAIRAINLGSDILCFPEGVWNKYPHELLLPFWPGIYKIANETGAKIVPVVNYIYDPTLQIDSERNPIHTVVDDPIDITQFSEKQGLDYLKDVLATWYYLMMEKYGKTSRENIIKFYENRAMEYNPQLTEKSFMLRPLTLHEAYELYLMDLLNTVDWYDSEIELTYDYRPKDIVRPEMAFEPIANIKNITYDNVWDVMEAKQLLRIRKQEDYQRRY